MKIVKRDDGWWITSRRGGDCGPYDTRAQAADDLPGLKRFEAENQDLYDEENRKMSETTAPEKVEVKRSLAVAVFQALGYHTAPDWNATQLRKKLLALPERADDGVIDDAIEDAKLNKRAKRLLQVAASGEFRLIDDSQPENPEKAAKPTHGQDNAKALELDGVTEAPDASPATDETTPTETEAAATEPESTPKAKRGRPKKAAGESKPKEKKASRRSESGSVSSARATVVRTIEELILSATSDSPITKEAILVELQNRFPDNDRLSLKRVVSLASKIKREGKPVGKSDSGYFRGS